jgi:lysine/ornithine N-monooxygenase
MSDVAEIVVVGAGPYGLSAAAHLRRAGLDPLVFGEPMSFWKGMPRGMLLRSTAIASSIVECEGALALDAFCAAEGRELSRPVGEQLFIDYGMWVQRHAAPDVDRRSVVDIQPAAAGFVVTLEDESRVRASRVVVAAGIASFAYRPPVGADLPPQLCSHTGDHRDLDVFAGRSVLVVGAGQSALETAALLSEAQADVQVLVRADHVNWLHGGKYHRKLGRFAPLLYAPTDVGPMGLSRLVAVPDLFRRLPRFVQEPLAYRSIRPAGAAWLRPRVEGVRIELRREVVAVDARGDKLRVHVSDGSTRVVDHLMFGTGYRTDLRRYEFLSPDLRRAIATASGYPVLSRAMESSCRGLHFLGAPAAWSFGPTARFVSGSWYGPRFLAQALAQSRRSRLVRQTASVPLGG